MPADNDPLVGLDELARMFEEHDGPPGPRRKPVSGPTRPALRWTGAVAAGALVAGSGLGFGLGSSLTPSGAAASTPGGLGFVPDSGWTVLQSGGDARPLQATFAIASSVPLHPDDDARGIRTSSGLPYATLLGLPRNGVVIVATFTIPSENATPASDFPERTLPLRLRDATPFVRYATQVRPERPLGEYQLRASINGRDVDLHFYFGTRKPSQSVATAAQRQLDGLVVHPLRRPAMVVEERALPLVSSAPVAGSATRLVDRTLVCNAGFANGTRSITVSAVSGNRRDGKLESLGHLTVTTPGNPVPTQGNFLPTLAGVSAGWPPPPPFQSDGIGYEVKHCKPSRAQVRLSSRGLVGGAVDAFLEETKCRTPKTVYVRLRVTFAEPVKLELSKKKDFVSALGRVRRGEIAVRTPAGRPLAYGEVLDSAKTRLFTAGNCF